MKASHLSDEDIKRAIYDLGLAKESVNFIRSLVERLPDEASIDPLTIRPGDIFEARTKFIMGPDGEFLPVDEATKFFISESIF